MVVLRKPDDAWGTEILCRLDDEAERTDESSLGLSLLSSAAVVVINGEDAVRYPAWESRERSGGVLCEVSVSNCIIPPDGSTHCSGSESSVRRLTLPVD